MIIMHFTAIDFETANEDLASICQIGLAVYKDGNLSEEWKTCVNPEDYFSVFNISIHGIDESAVEVAPTFPDLIEKLHSYLEDKVVVCHTSFDRLAMQQACKRYGLTSPRCKWIDTSRVARRAWKSCASKGYGLRKVCKTLGYEFKHHDALEDAKAAAYILLSAMKEAGLDLDEWLRRVEQPIDPEASKAIAEITREGNREGPLFGEVLVFTGALDIPRREAADLAAAAGCKVTNGVTKNTTILVVGDQDIRKLSGHEKSSKHRKAEDLVESGIPIRIIKESDFRELVKL